MKERSMKGMRAVVQDIIRKRIATLANSDQSNHQQDEYEKRFRIFVDEIIQLTTEQKCFTEDEMITESLSILIAVSFHLMKIIIYHPFSRIHSISNDINWLENAVTLPSYNN